MKLSWKPVRRGKVYCAPACGRGCTFEEFAIAMKTAIALAERLGPGWKLRVWENMGWHYEVVNGSACVMLQGRVPKDGYSANLDGRFWVHGKRTPESAIAASVLLAAEKIREIKRMIESVK